MTNDRIFSVSLWALLILQILSWCGTGECAEGWLGEHFTLENRSSFYYRSTGSGRDSDFYDHLYLRGHDLCGKKLDFYFSGRAHKDLDGTSKSLANDYFVGVEDLKPRWEQQVYQLYADLHDKNHRFGLRLGRQYIEESEALHVDGVWVRLFETAAVSPRIFLGRPVSYYTGASDDWAGGISLLARPWQNNRTRLSYVRYEENSGAREDEHYALELWQRLDDEF